MGFPGTASPATSPMWAAQIQPSTNRNVPVPIVLPKAHRRAPARLESGVPTTLLRSPTSPDQPTQMRTSGPVFTTLNDPALPCSTGKGVSLPRGDREGASRSG